MAMNSIPFQVAGRFAEQLSTGEIIRYGAILKHTETGRIVGHLQETGIFQSVLKQTARSTSLAAVNPVLGAVDVASSVVGVVQNNKMGKQLTDIQDMVGTLSAVNLVGTVASVAGVGVTLASTALILQRIQGIRGAIVSIDDKITKLPTAWHEMELGKTLRKIETQLERLEEAPMRKNSNTIVTDLETELHHGFNELYNGAQTLAGEPQINPELLRTVISGLALCSAGQYKSLLWLNEAEAAGTRSKAQAQKLNILSMQTPLDQLMVRTDVEMAKTIDSEMAELRAFSASLPGLCQQLLTSDIEGRHYLEAAAERDDDALLLLEAD